MRLATKNWKRLAVGAALLALLATGVAAIWTSTAAAAVDTANGCIGAPVLGRPLCKGYFTGRAPAGSAAVLYDGIRPKDADDFVIKMRNYLYDTYPDPCDGCSSAQPIGQRNNYGAASLVDAMLGKDGPALGGPSAALTYARTNFNRWEALVRDYDRRGLVAWDEQSASVDAAGGRLTRSAADPASADVYFKKSPFYVGRQIVFRGNGRNVLFRIERDSGSLVGFATPLQTATAAAAAPSPAPSARPDAVQPRAAGGDVTLADCQQVAGTASDTDAPGTAQAILVVFSSGETISAATDPATGLFSVPVPINIQQSPNTVTVRVYAGPETALVELGGSPRTVGPCYKVTATCGQFTVVPGTPDPSEPFNITVSVKYNSAAEAAVVYARPPTFYITVSGPGRNVRNTNVPFRLVGAAIEASLPQPATGQAGTYRVTWGLVSDLGYKDCAGGISSNPPNPPPGPVVTFPIANKPYFNIRNGDAAAGAGMSVGGTDCAIGPDPKANIVGWNRGPSYAYAGAGTQYAARAASRIQEFATAQGSPLAPTGMSFANAGLPAGIIDPNGGFYGGKFGSGDCIRDYFADATNVQTGNITIDGRAVPNRARQMIYVRGNAYITGNITFSGNYPDARDVPVFGLVVEGNIYIAPGVNRLDGMYIAQPSATSPNLGTVYTCAVAPFTAAGLDSNLHASCNNALTVNGAVSGREIWLLRTAGTAAEGPAETFNYTPELWMPAGYGDGKDNNRDYDAITSLPPVL